MTKYYCLICYKFTQKLPNNALWLEESLDGEIIHRVVRLVNRVLQ